MIPGYAWFILLYVATWLTIPSVLLSSKRPASMVAWIGATLFLPFIGPGLYLVFGTDRLRRKRLKRHRPSKRRSLADDDDGPIGHFDLTESEVDLVHGISRINEIPLTGIDSLYILEDADSYYGDLLEHLHYASHHIHIQTYVWRDDDTGRQFLDALCKAAKRGVKVRLLIDELGSFDTDEEFFKPLVEAGGEFSWFYTIHPRRNRYFLNLRNHRKLQIIDGNRAYIGGMNFGREYEGRDPELGEWRDLQVCITGAAIRDLQEIFSNDWYFATENKFSGDAYFTAPERSTAMPALFVESGPDSTRKPFLKSVISLCNFARESIDLFTPYFVPVSSLVSAFQIAAARGVRVRLMISEKNDHRYLVKIGRSYYEELLEFGVEIYEYSEAIHHAKAIIVDERWLMVGSANLDARSIDLNFELNILLRSPDACAELNKTYSEMFASSKRLDLEEFRKRPRLEKLGEGLSRLWAPLL